MEGLNCFKLCGRHFMKSGLVGVRDEDLNRVKVKVPGASHSEKNLCGGRNYDWE